MLSILIPTYNYDVTRLVSDLYSQAESLHIDFEIIVMEDGSQKCYFDTKSIKNILLVKYIVLTENIGRSAIRNLLADNALYDNLLFIDCDAEVASGDYLKKYLPFLNRKGVVVGGNTYRTDLTDEKYSLRLKYGLKRELGSTNFTTFNFLISKEIFQKIRFNETLKTYGYEDALFGAELYRQNIPVLFINNKLYHNGLDTNDVFLQKVENGLKNLYFLYQKNTFAYLIDTSKILTVCLKLKKWHLISVFSFQFSVFKSLIYKILTKKNPSLFLFDLYKLGILCGLFAKKA